MSFFDHQSDREALWVSGLVMVQRFAMKRVFEAGLRHVKTEKLSLSTQ